jgi:outer membrane protein OmpA-like peptidoglycan-associated protein
MQRLRAVPSSRCRPQGSGQLFGYIVMVKRETRFYRRSLGTERWKLAVGAILLGLASCNPVETYRHWTGISENDPNPATTPNTKNLAAGDATSYPNLATVPPPPSQALTTEELNKLTQSLIADRANAKYTSENLQAKFDEAAAPPPPPPPAPAAAPAGPALAGPRSAPNSTPTASAAPAVGAASAPSSSPGAARDSRKSGQPPEPGPMESSLHSPQITALPQPAQNQPAPPPPRELSVPAASTPGGAMAAGARLPSPPAPPSLPAAVGSANFQPPPAAPNFPPPAPVRTATGSGPTKPTKPPAPALAYTQVADIAFPGDATTLSDAERETLGKIVPRYREKPGQVRVVGYAGVGNSAAQQLSSYQTALDRAQAVAAALIKAGIPAGKIQVEAAPAGSNAGQGRAEILFGQ